MIWEVEDEDERRVGLKVDVLGFSKRVLASKVKVEDPFSLLKRGNVSVLREYWNRGRMRTLC